MSEFSEVKSMMESLKPIMDQVLNKMSKLKQETTSAKSEFKSLDGEIKKILANFAKNIVGGAAKGSDLGLMNILPKMLMSVISGARANGGAVAANGSYLVGERGPEIFTPNNSGMITPNHQINKSPVNVVMNITTPNADSFRKNQNQILVDAIGMMSRAGRNL